MWFGKDTEFFLMLSWLKFETNQHFTGLSSLQCFERLDSADLILLLLWKLSDQNLHCLHRHSVSAIACWKWTILYFNFLNINSIYNHLQNMFYMYLYTQLYNFLRVWGKIFTHISICQNICINLITDKRLTFHNCNIIITLTYNKL